MSGFATVVAERWSRLGPRFLPFADAASKELPLGRLLRLSLFQVSVGMATALLIGTLNRVLIVEFGVGAWLVATMVALPLVFAPFRALLGFRSDQYRSVLGWRRVPFVWFGSLLQFGGLAIMPFALMLLAPGPHHAAVIGHVSAALAFLLVGAGMQTVQTAGLALATDLAPPATRPRVVALMYVMLLVGMVGSGALFGWLLADFSPLRLIQVVQGAAVLTMVLNMVALWRQEARNPAYARPQPQPPRFADSWRGFMAQGRARRFLFVVGVGTAAFAMQDVILEPYGGEVLRLGVGATAALTALMSAGALAAYAFAASALHQGTDPFRLAAGGIVVGLFAFAAVTLSAPLDAPLLFRIGATAIGFGGGLFAVGTLAGAMDRERTGATGLALGAWGAVQATAGGLAIALGGVLRDAVGSAAHRGLLGPVLTDASVGYAFVYYVEIVLLFLTLAAIGPLVRSYVGTSATTPFDRTGPPRLGLADLPR